MTDELMHYGTPRHSGRYPWGSGENDEERSRSFLGYANELKKKGLSEVQIAKGAGISTTDYRALKSIARNEVQKADVALALRLKTKGLSNVAIGQRMGIAESSVRGLLNPALKDKEDILLTTANLLKSKVDDGSFLDIGSGTESHLGISSTKLTAAVAILRQDGYVVHNVQTATGNTTKTTVKVLAKPGTTYSDIVKAPERITSVAAYSENGGRDYEKVKPPVNVDLKRVGVVYGDEGGDKADGVIYLRPGVKDLSLGAAKYAQVRVAVNGTHYLKGMAMYKADLPEGTDIQFNTNKKNTGNKLDAMKPQKDDEENPFGSTVRQKTYVDENGKEKQSPLNIVNEEGSWNSWSRNLSSQFLSKQSPALAKRQLDLTLASRKEELDEINKLTNPVVKKKLLESFADNADSASVHLKAAALPRQETKVILPFASLKPNEIYAPTLDNGTKVALVRFPHGGTFEIPEVTVNNKNREAHGTLSGATDAIGIHPDIAKRLSGADFDGDTVLVIPNKRGDVKTSPPLAGLKDFDPQQAYPAYDGMKPMTARAKQQQMGDVSNLITDMSIKGAKPDELARAVRHSMVVIDAEKHNLNYKQSYVDNGIASLKEKYQGRGANGRLSGASTVVSRASSEIRVPDRKLRKASEGGPIDPVTGEKIYTPTGKTHEESVLRKESEGGPIDPVTGKKVYVKTGRIIVDTNRSTKLAEAKNAHDLSSGMPIEEVYADHSNALKALANEARKSSLYTGKQIYSPTANKTYASQVARLNADLNIALKNKPLERQAQLIANAAVEARRAANPGIEAEDLKKIKGQQLLVARQRVGAAKQQIMIDDDQWAAIQAGAITGNKLSTILDNADQTQVRKLATPRASTVVTPAKLAIAQARLASGYTQAEIAESLGIPVSTLNSALLSKGG